MTICLGWSLKNVRETQKFNEKCNQSLLHITEECKACTEEVENARLTQEHIKMQLMFRRKELSPLQRKLRTLSNSTQKRRDDLKQEEGSLLEFIGAAAGFYTIGGGGATAGATAGGAAGSLLGPVGEVAGAFIGFITVGIPASTLGVQVGAHAGRAVNNLLKGKRLEQVKKEIEACKTILTLIEVALEQLTDSISTCTCLCSES